MQTSARQRKRLERWKANAKLREERLARVLSKEPKGLNAALRREARLRRIEQRLATREQWLEAFREHTQTMGGLIERAVVKTSATVAAQAPSRGSAGDTKRTGPSRKQRA
jgi:hypothetical protein